MRGAIFLAVTAAACSPSPAALHPRIQDLSVLEGTEVCDWAGEGEHAICRRMLSNTTAALQYPLLLQSQGWRQTTARSAPIGGMHHNNVIWFERAIDRRCAEIISMELIPAAPLSENTNPILVIQTDYDPECERKAS